MNKKVILRILKIIFVFLAILFVLRQVYKNIDDLKNTTFTINWPVFAVSMLFYFLYKISLASLWHYITLLNGTQIEYKKAMISYFYSILGKYIPGKVFMLGARIVYYKDAGARVSKVTICFFIENLCTLLGAAFLFIVSLFFFPNELLNQYRLIVFVLIVLFFIIIHPKIINFVLSKIEKITKKDDLKIPITYFQMLKLVSLFILNWIIVGIGFSMLVYSFYPFPVNQILFISGVFALSAIIGILTLFAPSGIGVREGIILLCLGMIMPEHYAVVISVISRLWATIPELVLVLITFIYERLQKLTHNHVNKNITGGNV